jgi:hypothetical protein
MKRALLVILFALTAIPSQAAVILYTDEAAYLAAVGGTREYIDFAGSPAAVVSGGSFSPVVTFGSCTDSSDVFTCFANVFHNDNAITDTGGSAVPNGVGSLAWRFDVPDVYAFGFNYLSGGIDAINFVDLGFNVTSIDTSAANGFIGLVSDTPFFIGIAVNAILSPDIGNDRYFIDDFRINAVPEPASLVLVGVGLGLGAMRLRRGKRAA